MSHSPILPPVHQPSDTHWLEKASSAVTLSDMEIFIFPELLFSLVLANIMSPRIWAWRDDPWFEGIESKSPYRRVLRLKQYIMDHYDFNLDLDTWGLTTQARELKRFSTWIDEETLSRSNALFGYEGDKYYFDMDIRKHFGLDKYGAEEIPYWKTETVEAMDAFLFKPGFTSGAGECVSLSTLYAAALFVVCRIPLKDIFLLATPLHSQNFIDVQNGVLTNNRRIVTKNMWFNGSELSYRAQRALRNEQVTVVAHHTGWIHSVYDDATIAPAAYRHLKERLSGFLRTEISYELLTCFLRQYSQIQKCFQIRHEYHGKPRYIAAEKVYAYEHNSAYKVSDNTRDKLLAEIDEYEFYSEPIERRIELNMFDTYFHTNRIDLATPEDQQRLRAVFTCQNTQACEIVRLLVEFARIDPRFPDRDKAKSFVKVDPIEIDPDMSREQIVEHLASIRTNHPIAELSFYAGRDMAHCDWAPFLKAAIERSPVSVRAAEAMSDEEVLTHLHALPGESIYDGTRLAQPDEVWNYGRGDGLERALCLAGIRKARKPEEPVSIRCDGASVTASFGAESVTWPSAKGLRAAFSV